MEEIVTKPSADDIRQADAEFDSENKILEEALQELFGQYPHNTQPAQVLLKVTALNTLYSTHIPLYSARVPTIFDVTDHLVNLRIDSDLRLGSPELVARIAKIQVSNKAGRYYYSFATKYCNWHNPTSYPIFDSRVVQYLWHLRSHNCLGKFRQSDLWDYPKLRGIVEEFQEKNGLRNFTFKEIDKFLYLQGGALLKGSQ